MPQLAELEALARAGLLTDTDIVQAHNAIDGLADINAAALGVRARGERLTQAVDNYRMSMAPRFGVEASLPVGDL